MTMRHLDIESTEWAASRNIARALNHWMVMDMTLVARQGHMKIGSTYPAGLTGKLVDWGVLRISGSAGDRFLIKGPRFDAVCKASREIFQKQSQRDLS